MSSPVCTTIWRYRVGILHTICLLVLVAALLPIAAPFMDSGFPHGHDTATHLANLFRFDRAWEAGQRPVRWVEGLTPGHGQPLFNFYQVGFFYMTEGVHALGIPLSAAIKALPVALWWVSALFVFLWLRPFGLPAAAAGTITFALSPYAIVDVFVRAAYPEFSALVFTCGALWAADSFLRSGRESRCFLFAVCVALILVCHLPALMIGAPALLAELVAVGIGTQYRPRRVAALIAVSFLAVGIAAFYVLPALIEQPLVQINGLTVGSTDFHRHFVPAWLWTHFLWTYEWNYFGTSVSDPAALMPVHISLVQWAAFGVSLTLIAGAVLMRRAAPRVAYLTPWALVMAYAMFMMNDASVRLWELFPFLRFIQFPWRFFLLISIAGAALTAALIAQITKRMLAAGVTVLVLLFHLHFYERRLRPERYIPYAEMNIDSPDWMRHLARGARDFEEPSYDPVGVSRSAAPAGVLTVTSGRAVTSIIRHADTDLQVRVASFGDSRVQVNIPQFPGWSITVDGMPRAAARTDDGYYAVDIGNGPHMLQAQRANTAVETASNWVTLFSTAILALWWASTAWRAGKD